MMYFIDRNGQPYGPYTLGQLRGYLSGGSIQPGDLARNAETGEVLTVAALVTQYTTPYALPDPAFPRPDHAPVVSLPPNLHWAVVLLIGIFFNPFPLGWAIYQMVWVRQIDRESKALVLFLSGLGAMVAAMLVGGISLFASVNANPQHIPVAGFVLMALGGLAMWVLNILSAFDLRRSMLAYYNTVEPIGLRLSGVMTFFFNVYYFQHHLSRIATWKLTGYLSPQG
jgi:hypothetical protein